MKKFLLFLLTAILCLPLSAQNIDYISHTMDYKTPVTAVNISPDGAWILAGLEDGTLRVLDTETYEELMVIENAGTSAIYDIEMSPKMDVIFLATGNTIMLYDTTGNHVTNWGHHNNTIWCMDIDPYGKFMLSTEVNKTFQLTNVYEGMIEQSMRAHEDITLAVAFAPDGGSFASGSNDRKVFLWDMETREVTSEFQGLSDNIYDIAFSPDGTLLAAGSRDQTVRIWDIRENKLSHIIKGHQDMVLEIEFSPDGKYFLTASADHAIKLWDLDSGEQLYAYLENEGSIPDIEFLPDGKSFVSAGMDGHLKVWELHPEIFVLKYYQEEYEEELNNNPDFLPRQKGEKRADYQLRTEEAQKVREGIISKYYEKYLAGE